MNQTRTSYNIAAAFLSNKRIADARTLFSTYWDILQIRVSRAKPPRRGAKILISRMHPALIIGRFLYQRLRQNSQVVGVRAHRVG